MKNRNTQLTAILFVVAFALAPIVQAGPRPDGGPIRRPLTRPRRLTVVHRRSLTRRRSLTVAQPTSHLLRALMRTARQSPRVRIAR